MPSTDFGSEGSLADRLSSVLLPILRELKKKGVRIFFDDIKPSDIYVFDDARKKKKGEPLRDSHATTSELVMQEDWLVV